MSEWVPCSVFPTPPSPLLSLRVTPAWALQSDPGAETFSALVCQRTCSGPWSPLCLLAGTAKKSNVPRSSSPSMSDGGVGISTPGPFPLGRNNLEVCVHTLSWSNRRK